jgi:hypothetical protein
MDIIGHIAIPYDLDEREKKLTTAYNKLDKYIQKWRRLKKLKNMS